MISQTKYFQLPLIAQQRNIRMCLMNLFAKQAMLEKLIGKSVPTSQNGSMKSSLMNTWILMIASLHVRHQSMDVKLAQMKNIHSNALKMGARFVFILT